MTTATVPSPGLRDTTRSEWTKLRSVRSTWMLLALAAVIGIGLSLLFTYAAATTFPAMPAADRAKFDAAATARVGIDLSVILFVVFGALTAASEFASGMMRLTLTVTPNRLRVLTAKAIMVALPSYVAGVVLTTVAFLGGQAIIRSADPSMAVGLGSPGVLPSLVNWGTEMAAFALIALSLALLLRSAAGAIATSIGIVFAPAVFAQLLPLWVRQHIVTYLPASAAENLTNTHRNLSSATYLDPQVAGWVLGAWVLAFLASAYLALSRRDSG
jgi:ABC-2 type transport system permease protein